MGGDPKGSTVLGGCYLSGCYFCPSTLSCWKIRKSVIGSFGETSSGRDHGCLYDGRKKIKVQGMSSLCERKLAKSRSS